MSFSRRILFIGGYDPNGGRRVYLEQSKHIALYNARFGKALRVGTVDNAPGIGLSWTLTQESEQSQARFDLLRWDDLVRHRWARDRTALTRETLVSLWVFAKSGCLLHMWRLSAPLVCAAMLPFAFALFAICAPLLAGLIATGMSRSINSDPVVTWSTTLIAATVTSLLINKSLRRLPVTWFSRVVAFARHYAHESPTSMGHNIYRQRIRSWAEVLKADLINGAEDEILIVGYSAGSILATGLMNELNQLLPTARRDKLALLTLGNCIPVSACLPVAVALRNDLQNLAIQRSFWVDITSPNDWGAIHGVDVCRLYGNALPSPSKKQLSPRFHTLFTAASYKVLSKDKYRVHQQYLLCTELLGDSPQAYDYFALLCGPLSLRQRYSSLTPSPS